MSGGRDGRRRGLEVKLGLGPVKNDGGAVVSGGGFFSGGESAEPLARAFSGLANLGDPFAPTPLPHASVSELAIVRTSFAFGTPGASRVAFMIVVRGCMVNGGSWFVDVHRETEREREKGWPRCL